MSSRPNIPSDSPLQDWTVIRMLAAMGTSLQCQTAEGDTFISDWSPAPAWSDRSWWNDWAQWQHLRWSFRIAPP